MKSERKLPCRVSPTAVVFKSAPSVIPGDYENDACSPFLYAKNARRMNESMENRSREIERGGNVDWKLVDFLEDSNRKDSSNIDRSIRRRESSGNIWDSKLANWKSGKVESRNGRSE